jgi:hypothetical protein
MPISFGDVKIQDSSNSSKYELKSGSEVYSCGFGYFTSLDYPSLYKGYVTRVVKD